MEYINRCVETLNKESREFKLLKRIEKRTGIEPGSSAVIFYAILLGQVIFGSYPRLICEVQSIAYPVYATLFFPEKFWYTYWLFYSAIILLFAFVPGFTFLYIIRFGLTLYMMGPNVMNSYGLHDFLSKSVYQSFK
jgi:hypothetical protein